MDRRLLVVGGLLALSLAACQSAPTAGPGPSSAGPSSAGSSSAGSSSAVPSSASPSTTSPSSSSSSPGPTEIPPSVCRLLVNQMSPKQQAGQLLMMGVVAPVTEHDLVRLQQYQIGSVVLLGPWTSSAQVRTATQAVTSLNMAVPVVAAADQEGGSIQRLKGSGLPPIPSAVGQRALTPAQLSDNWTKWGSQLSSVGVRYDLAPVADVVPAAKQSTNQPIGRLNRSYGATPQQAAPLVAATVTGLGKAGIGTSLKHFPGLGEVTTNTDFGAATDTTITRTDPGLEVFRAGIEAGASSVMVSSAVYAKIDPENQGVFSTIVITEMLRGDLGFDGLVISDDLGSAASVSGVPVGQRAVRFVRAGGDLVINADPQTVDEMANALASEAAQDPAFAEQVARSATRVVEFKESLGLVRCS